MKIKTFICIFLILLLSIASVTVFADTSAEDVLQLYNTTKYDNHFRFTVKINNENISCTNAYITVAIYDNSGKLIDISMENIECDNNLKEAFLDKNTDIGSYKIMLFSSDVFLRPICKSLSNTIKYDDIETGFRPISPNPGYDDYLEGSGVVTGVFETTLEGISCNLNKEQIMFNDEVFYIGDYSIDCFYPYIGKEINITYEEDGPNKVIIDFEEGRNESLTVCDVDIDSINNREITYYEGSKKEELALASDLYVVYNGYGVEKSTITDSFIAQYLDVESGEITFINNDGKSDYDVAFVTSYETMFVKNRLEDAANGTVKIYDEHGNISDITLKNGDCKVYKVTSKGGNKTEVTGDKPLLQVAANTVVSIAAPIGKTEGTEVVISTVKLTGKSVDSISSYDITIGGEDYDFSAYYNALVSKDSSKYEATKGDAGTFYLDFLGRLVYYSKSQTAEPYGYLAAIEESRGLSSSVTAYIFKQDGKWLENVPLAEKISINGTKYNSSQAIYVLMTTAAIINENKPESVAINADVAQLIKYRYENGEITAIYTISPDASNLENGNIVPGKFIANADNETEATPFTKGTMLNYKSNTFSSIGSNGNKPQFNITSSSIVFYIPYDRTANLDDYKKKTTPTENYRYLAEPYDVKGSTAKVVLIYVANGTTDAKIKVTTQPAFIHAKGHNFADDYDYLKVYIAGSESLITKRVSDKCDISYLNEGDVIKFVEDSGEICGIQKIFVGGHLYEIDTNDASGFTTTPATSNHLIYANESGTDPDYYEVILGYAIDKYEDEEYPSYRTLSLVADGDDYENWKTFSIKSTTKFYKFEELEGERDVWGFVPKTADDCFIDINTMNGTDTSDATKILAIKLSTDDTLKAVYIIE